MAGDLTMTLIYEKDKRPNPNLTLKAARNMLALLATAEKEVRETQRARFIWDINIYSLNDRAVIEFTLLENDRSIARKIAERAVAAQEHRATKEEE